MSPQPPGPIGQIRVGGENRTLYLGNYTQNQRIALFIVSENGEQYATISRNLPNLELEGDEFFVGWYDLNPQIMLDLIDSPYFEDTGKFALGENVKMPVWRLRPLIGVIGGEE